MTNRNFLHTKSYLTFNDLPDSVYYLQKFNIPGFSIDAANQGTRFQNVPLPGDSLRYNTFNPVFIMDENLTVLFEINSWIRKNNTTDQSSDFSLHIYNNVSKSFTAEIYFTGGWVSQQNDIQFDFAASDTTDTKLLDVQIRYAYYEITLL